jgi:hypothetical protein
MFCFTLIESSAIVLFPGLPPGAFFYSRRQLLAKAVIAASRVAALAVDRRAIFVAAIGERLQVPSQRDSVAQFNAQYVTGTLAAVPWFLMGAF